MKEKIARWYPKAWRLEMVANAVKKRVITAEEFKEITGEDYSTIE